MVRSTVFTYFTIVFVTAKAAFVKNYQSIFPRASKATSAMETSSRIR